MNLNLFLAKKIGSKTDSTGKLSRMGSIISVASVAVSIAVIIISAAVSDGFRNEIREKARGFSGDYILTSPGEDILTTRYPVNSNLSYKGNLEKLHQVESINAVSYAQGILKTENEIEGLLLKGVDSTYNMEFYRKHLSEGKLPQLQGKRASNEILVSRQLANALQYKVGDKATAYFIGEQIKVRRFDITGIFDAQLEQYDKNLAVGDIRQVARLNGWENEVSGYEVVIGTKYLKKEQETTSLLDETIYRNITEEDSPIAVKSLGNIYYTLFDWLNLLDLNVLIILILMMAVAGFNMVSALLIMLFERISQIGLLKAMGMSNSAIAKIYLTKSAIVVLQGALIGNIIAITLCLLQQHFHIIALNPNNYFVAAVPISLNAGSVLLMNSIAFIGIMLIMLLPCMFIAKINPATTMRIK